MWLVALTPAYVTTPVAATDSALFGGVALVVVAANRGYRLRTAGAAVALYCAWLAGSLFWLLPLLESTSAVSATGLAAGDPVHLFGLNSVRLVDAVRLAGYWGVTTSFAGAPYFAWKGYYTDVALWSAIAIPVLVVLGAAFASTRRLATGLRLQHDERIAAAFLVAVELVSLFLITGDPRPLGGLKATVVRDLDLAGPFRSVYQPMRGYLALACAALAAVGLDVLARSWRRFRRGGAAGQALAWSAIALAVVVPCWPNVQRLDARRVGKQPGKAHRAAEELLAGCLADQRNAGRLRRACSTTRRKRRRDRARVGRLDRASRRSAQPGRGLPGVEPLELMLAKGVIVNDATAPYLFDWAQSIAHADRNMTNALHLLNLGYIVLHLDENLPFYWKGLAPGREPISAPWRDASTSVETFSLVYASSSLRVYRVLDWRPFRVFSVPRGSTDPLLEARDLQPVPYDLGDQGTRSPWTPRRPRTAPSSSTGPSTIVGLPAARHRSPSPA